MITFIAYVLVGLVVAFVAAAALAGIFAIVMVLGLAIAALAKLLTGN